VKPKTTVKESVIEERCRQIALKAGWVSRKMNGFGFRSWPDRLFIPPDQTIKAGCEAFWVEFKRPKELPTPDQERVIEDLGKRGEKVFVCDSVEDFKNIIWDQSHA
jgi:hypothetical protein